MASKEEEEALIFLCSASEHLAETAPRQSRAKRTQMARNLFIVVCGIVVGGVCIRYKKKKKE